MKKEKKSVQSVTEPKPEKEVSPKPSNVEVASQKEASTADVKEVPQKLIEIPQVDEDTKAMLRKAGFGWDTFVQGFEKINIWAESVDDRFNVILQKMPTEKGIAEELMKRSMEERQKLAQAQPQGSTGNVGGGGLGGIAQIATLVKEAIGSSSGSSELQDKIMNMALESMSLGNALVKTIILKTAPELANQIFPPKIAGA